MNQENNPLQLIKESGKFGVSTIFSMLAIIILFAIINIIIFIYSFNNGF